MNPATISDRVTVRSIFDAFTATDITPPAAVQAARERLTSLSDGIRNRHAPRGDGLALAVIAAIEGGHNPASDPEVQRIITAQALAAMHALPEAIESVAMDALRESARTHADAMVEAWRPAFTAAAADLTAAHAYLGNVDLEDTDAIIRRGGDAADAWGRARAAVATIDLIRNGWQSLYSFTVGRVPNKRHHILVIVDAGAEMWAERKLDGRAPEPWAATVENLPLALSTFGGYRARLAEITAHRATPSGRPVRAEAPEPLEVA